MDAVTPKSKSKTETNKADTHSHLVRPAAMEWQKTRFPGCEAKTLLFDHKSGLMTALMRFAPGAVSTYADLYTHLNNEQLQALLLYPSNGSCYAHFRTDDFREEQFLVDLYCWLADSVLPLVVTLTSRVDLPLALPFCADEIVELGARIPLSCKVRSLDAKWLLKQVASSVVPAWVLKGRRSGFTLPIAPWFRGPLRHLLDTYLDTGVIERRGVFRPEGVRDLVRAHVDGAADFSLPLWALLTLEIWQRIFLDH